MLRIQELQEEVKLFDEVKKNINISFQIQMEYLRKEKTDIVNHAKELEATNEQLKHKVESLDEENSDLKQKLSELEALVEHQVHLIKETEETVHCYY